MRKLYNINTANFPRMKIDEYFADYKNKYKFNGYVEHMIDFIEKSQLLDCDLWKCFVHQFRQEDVDSDSGWRGEFWGKMMRGACFTYSYSRNDELFEILKESVLDMMSVQEKSGRISTYGINHEFDAWDIWGRKYVLLGMQYFLEICDDEELNNEIIKSMCAQTDYIMSKVGPREEGKIPITSATHHWRGLNSSSLLEPVIRLYSITGEKKYLDFATYIVNCGGTDCENLFELAYEDKLYPYQYPVTKAYEMTSCFEGLLEYYRVTGIEKYKVAVINFAKKVLESDFTIIGCCGCTHELFDRSAVRQANTTNNERQQETCVTVTLMKFFYQLTLLTGEAMFSDAFEVSMYNAFFGSVNTDNAINPAAVLDKYPDSILKPMPFDSYSPLVAGTRGVGVGGLMQFSDNNYYGCCACIGAAGNGLIAKMANLTTKNGIALNLYIDGYCDTMTPSGNKIRITTETQYPVSGRVCFELSMSASEEFEIKLRNPYWSIETSVAVNGREIPCCDGYISIVRTWSDGDIIELSLDMSTEAIHPMPYGHEILMNKVIWGLNYVVPTYDEEDPIAKKHIALRRGPVILAQENRLGYSVDNPVDIAVSADGIVEVVFPDEELAPYDKMIEVCVPLNDGSYMHVTDYASAGKTWTEESKMAAWMLTK